MKPYLKVKVWDTNGGSHNPSFELRVDTCIATKNGDHGIDALLLNIKTGYQLQMNEKFYFTPGVTVPRVKLKDLASSHKARTVRDMESATVIFISNKTYSDLCDMEWQNYVETDLLKEFLESANNAGQLDDYYYDKFKTAVEFYTTEEIMIDWGTVRELKNVNLAYTLSDKSKALDEGSDRTVIVKDNYLDFYMELIEKPVYMENELYPYLNGPDATVIDENMYEALQDMLKSSDRDNHVLAMEIMANCDWDKSIMYLAFLLDDFAYNIEQQRSRTHVNFKSFLSYMGKNPNSFRLDKDYIIRLIIGKGLLTKDIAQTILNKYAYEINHPTTYFKVKTITLNEEVEKLLGEEIALDTKSLNEEEDDEN